ncbi:hypothetical protein MYCTH_2309420 [Thermothelomyces thermophilus ATCC 42464]|uniref:Uncharacterized protein n=1 Tax=Thermothelomyces thermophilus (strain ATCC 42464 / BCRC 31852 / DSM 1799) TaxID=573729 RepID=G2QIC3_THET4|nr:uncharacterized protein MYCTH_2309420 [Thermothelomyces thermophilus ATCC 42464]AEO60297.1 hypothetical protein MYCTH_2309420 [Thermothelomyces thermophilus ATCC 42464]
MVRRALSHRRSSGLDLKVDTAALSPDYNTIPIMIFTRTARRESLPHSRHHQLRRSSSVSSRSTVSSSSSSSSSSSTSSSVARLGGSNSDGGGKRGTDSVYDGGSVIEDEADETLDEENEKEGDLEVAHVG